MYNSDNLVAKIKNRAKEKGVLIRDMLTTCGLNINALNQLTDRKGLSSFALARIADYLDCSVDYLLGRTDIPEVQRGEQTDQTYQIRIAARGGGVKDITLTSAQLAAIKNLPEVTDLEDD